MNQETLKPRTSPWVVVFAQIVVTALSLMWLRISTLQMQVKGLEMHQELQDAQQRVRDLQLAQSSYREFMQQIPETVKQPPATKP